MVVYGQMVMVDGVLVWFLNACRVVKRVVSVVLKMAKVRGGHRGGYEIFVV